MKKKPRYTDLKICYAKGFFVPSIAFVFSLLVFRVLSANIYFQYVCFGGCWQAFFFSPVCVINFFLYFLFFAEL